MSGSSCSAAVYGRYWWRIVRIAGVALGVSGLVAGGNGEPAFAKPEGSRYGVTVDALAAADQTYLGLTNGTMRQQLVANDLEAAERTLGWILRINPDDEMARVLAAELQLRRGNVAIAAMKLLTIVDLPATGEAARIEADRILQNIRRLSGEDGLRLSEAADFVADDLPPQIQPVTFGAISKEGESGLYAYTVQAPSAPTARQMASVRKFAAVTPMTDPDAFAGPVSLTVTGSDSSPTLLMPSDAEAETGTVMDPLLDSGVPAAAASQQIAAVASPPPVIPQGEQANLIDLLFADPGNLQLNFAVFQEQLSANDLDGASATLERVLLIDPKSKLAKVLLADVNLRKGNFLVARNILVTLLDEDDTPDDMAERAGLLLEQVEDRLETFKVQTRLALELGHTENAFGRAKSDEILFLNLPLTNTTPDKSDVYANYSVSVTALRELNRQTPTLLEAGVSVTGRDTRHKDLSDLRTLAANVSLTEKAMINKSLGAFASVSRVNHLSFNRNAGLFFAVSMPVANGWELNQSISASRSTYATYPGLAANTGRSDRSLVAKLGISRQFERALVNLALSAGRSKARNKIYDRKFRKAEFTMAGMLGDFSLTGTLSRQWTRNDHADPFVSPLKSKQRQDARSLKVQYPRGGNVGGLFFVPYMRMSSTSTKSNIPNNRREGAEAAIGIETAF